MTRSACLFFPALLLLYPYPSSSTLTTMDSLVAQYSRPAHQQAFYSDQEQHDLTETAPPISLKFDLPPVDNVRAPIAAPDALQLPVSMAASCKKLTVRSPQPSSAP